MLKLLKWLALFATVHAASKKQRNKNKKDKN
jgi:hypothetical protein